MRDHDERREHDEHCTRRRRTASRVVANELPAGDRKDRLAHCCTTVESLLEADDHAVAIECLRAIRTRHS